MTKVRCFVSFDYDNDVVLKQFLIGQSKKDDSPFEISDWSIKEASSDWKTKARARIRSSDVVIVICGKNTDTATGVATELSITQEERKDYFSLPGIAMAVIENQHPQGAVTRFINGHGIISRL